MMYTCNIYIYIYMYIYIYIYIFVHVCLCMYIYIYIYINTCVCIYTSTYVEAVALHVPRKPWKSHISYHIIYIYIYISCVTVSVVAAGDRREVERELPKSPSWEHPGMTTKKLDALGPGPPPQSFYSFPRIVMLI